MKKGTSRSPVLQTEGRNEGGRLILTSNKGDIVGNKCDIVLRLKARMSSLLQDHISSSHGCHMGSDIGHRGMNRNMCKAIVIVGQWRKAREAYKVNASVVDQIFSHSGREPSLVTHMSVEERQRNSGVRKITVNERRSRPSSHFYSGAQSSLPSSLLFVVTRRKNNNRGICMWKKRRYDTRYSYEIKIQAGLHDRRCH